MTSPFRGATPTAEKLKGTEVWVQRPGWVLGACGRESPPPAVRVRGYHPGKFVKDAKSCILVTTMLISGLPRKLRPISWGDQYIVGPPT